MKKLKMLLMIVIMSTSAFVAKANVNYLANYGMDESNPLPVPIVVKINYTSGIQSYTVYQDQEDIPIEPYYGFITSIEIGDQITPAPFPAYDQEAEIDYGTFTCSAIYDITQTSTVVSILFQPDGTLCIIP